MTTTISTAGHPRGAWLTVPQVADYFQVDEPAVRRWIRSGKLTAILLGGRKLGYRVHADRVAEFEAARLVSPGEAT